MKKFAQLLCLFAFALVGVEAKIRVISPLSFDYEGAVGESFTDSIVIVNPSDNEAVTAKITQRDYSFDATGASYFLEPGEVERSNVSWVDIETKEVTLPPKGQVKIPFKVTIPKKEGEDLSGTYWSVALVEPMLKPMEIGEDQKGLGIRSVVRYAVQFISTIAGTGRVDMRVADKTLIREGDKTYYQFTLENTGSRVMSPNLWMEVFSGKGENKGKFTGNKTRLYPNTSTRHRLDVTNLDLGDYSGLLVFDQKDADFFGSQVSFSIADIDEKVESVVDAK